jgi:hypothetical protein
MAEEVIRSIEELRNNNRAFIESARKSGNLDGIKKLLTDLYPDNAHFIYELLQNAEDTHATKVRFTLKGDALIFEHNGEAFNLNDVGSITKIGESTKPEDATKIGKFGVGFKAVFAYTETPEIHSGNFHFRIIDMLIPEIDINDSNSGKLGTRFVFPFNHPIKKTEQAIAEIHRALCDLGPNTLLFLSHIHTIEYTLENGAEGSIQRIDHDDGHIEILLRDTDGSSESSHWLRFQKEIVIPDGGKNLKRQYAIAYGLKQTESNNNEDPSWSIVPLDNGQVSIYFPAVKEPCALKFHIHAPFASTVARDSVRDCDENNRLRDRIAELVVDSLSEIRERGLLNMSLLATLPNKHDGLSRFLDPIRQAIVEAFKSNSFTPTRSGQFAPASKLFRGPAKISEVIGDENLAFLTSREPPLWAANPPQQSQREDRFLDSLDMDTWDWWALEDIFFMDDDDERELFDFWVQQKTDTWLRQFYALLGYAIDNHSASFYGLEEIRLVRVVSEEGDDHVRASEAFFASEQEPPAGTDIHFVKQDVYNKGRSDLQKKLALSFLQEIGVQDFDERVVIELKLNQYSNGQIKVTKAYYNDIKRFIRFWKSNPHSSKELFSQKRFLLTTKSDTGGTAARLPSHLCLDRPYLDTGLEELQHIHKKPALWDGYWNNIGVTQRSDLVEFLKSIGVIHELGVTEADIYHNENYSSLVLGFRNARPNDSSISYDYTIQSIADYILMQSKSASLLLWNAALKAETKTLSARYRPNKSHIMKRVDSQLVQILRGSAWIPDRSGIFRRPQEMTQEDLPEGFVINESNGLLFAIGFGADAKKKGREYRAINDAAVAIGFESIDDAKRMLIFLNEMRVNGLSDEDIEAMIPKKRIVAKPEESVANPERRRKGVLERTEMSPTRESVKRERSIQLGLQQEAAKAKAYLRAKYTNQDGQMICQACQLEMPFKIKDEHYYFEATQCVSGLEKHFFQNRLALCPTCAAKYMHARDTTDDELRNAITDNELSETASFINIEVKLAGERIELHFVGPHWFDLKTVLKGE